MSSSAFGPSKARLLELSQLSKRIFRESFNPDQVRRGSRVLRAPLKGPVIQDYYMPNNFLKFKYLKKEFPELYLVDAKEQYRLHINQDRRRRGKGAPQKKSEPPAEDKSGKKKK
ncbi:mitochondrial 37S ribosomal protein mS33 [Magnusiomyces paraingens]|uniref:Small ribosomal subunit protein mS33 n=1 Tax=Magnusiomyces paraingens TaxID=2606893 RepID=A0A5E8AYS2_9ASCO|nr:uncharacterized protein SAPINGB_P000371 [Saprochaete ingens]VVT44302.1 unnamed protein product [Saprochaete ingens]